MATGTAGLTVVDQVVQSIQENESKTKKKANTVTTALGSVATFVAAGLSALVESNTDLPTWFPFLVVAVGMLGTTYGVSKTKNGMTESIADKLHREIAARIDENHFHDEIDDPVTDQFQPQPWEPPKETQNDVEELRRIAENMIRNIR
ncbi:holin [Gordonia phage Rickmore]|uniref:Holin n=1 Tax=Gordonia phage Rickmore TaxID=2507854 RepID=A0A410TB28_9CAUD|nr:holin [Gordonia phage Rickmore]QAU06248.1 holin [Gordonia phage Rickmore]